MEHEEEQEQAYSDDFSSETIKNLQLTDIDEDYISNLHHYDRVASARSHLRLSKIDYISKLPYDLLERIVSIHPRDSGSKAVAVFTGLVDRPCIKHVGKTVKIQDFETGISDLFFYYKGNDPLKAPRNLEFHFTKQMIVTASIGLNNSLNLDCSKVLNQGESGNWETLNNTMRLALSPNYPYYIKSLKLTSVKHLSHELVSHMIFKFPDIKCFILEKCNYGSNNSLRVEGFYGLKDLRILDCVGIESVYVEALELRSLRCRGSLCPFTFYDVVYLKDVKLDCIRPAFNHLNHELFNPLLQAIQGVEVLTIHGWMFKEIFEPLLCKEDTNNQHFIFSQVQDLWWIDSCMEEDSINSLFCFLKFCTSLERLFITINPQSYASSKQSLSDHYEHSSKVEKWRLCKLKVVKFEGFRNNEDMMDLNDRLRNVFKAKPLVVDASERMYTRVLIRKAATWQTLKFNYKFREETRYLKSKKLSNHPHMP